MTGFLLIIPYLLIHFNTLQTHAAAFLEPETRVLFQLPEEYVVTRITNRESRITDRESRITESYEIRNPGASVHDRFELEVSVEALEKLLERLRFQSLASEQLRNRDIKGKTAIEAIGKDHETGELGKLVVFSHGGKSIAIQYFGTESSRFEAFLSDLAFPLAPFSDTNGHAFEKEIAEMAESKIMKGYLAKDLLSYEFRPEAPITRAEFLKTVAMSIPGVTEDKILNLTGCHSEPVRLPFNFARGRSGQARIEESLGGVFGNEIPSCGLTFSDVKPVDWFSPFVQFATELGWVKGYADSTFRPHATITVAEAMKLLIASRDIFVEPAGNGQQWYEPYFDVIVDGKILINAMRDFSTPPTPLPPQVGRNDRQEIGMTLTPSSALTRSQAAALIVRLDKVLKTEESSW